MMEINVINTAIEIQPCTKPIAVTTTLPGSKSITNRALLLAALASGESQLLNVLHSEDTLSFMQALRDLGVVLDYDQARQQCLVQGCHGQFPDNSSSVWCQDSGITARFLLAACANQSGCYHFSGTKRLTERPLHDLVTVLRAQGAQISSDELPLTITGQRLRGGNIGITGQISSQFLSALLIIAPYMQHEVCFTTTNELISKPYIELTCAMMASFGVQVQSVPEPNQAQYWRVSQYQTYQGQRYIIEPDLSAASYFFAAAAVLGSSVTIEQIDRNNCLQGDIDFLSVLEQMGCLVKQVSNKAASASVTIIGPSNGLCGVTVDMGDISDTMMTLAAIAPFANSPTLITNIANTRLKESDRIDAIVSNLTTLGIRTESGADYLKIYPGLPTAGVIDSFNDHRIAMSCALIGLKVPGIIIDRPACVAKTFPDYFTQLTQLFCIAK